MSVKTPATVRAFFGLSLVLALWWIWGAFSDFVLPSQEFKAAFGRLPQPFRDITLQGLFESALTFAALNAAILLLLSSIAMFARRNWARWTLVAYFIVLQAVPIGYAMHLYFAQPDTFQIVYHSVSEGWHAYLQRSWSQWPFYATAGLELALIVLMFSPNARPWFTPEPTERPEAMPVSVRVFLAICAAIAGWMMYVTAHHYVAPSPEQLAKIARLPDSYQAIAEMGNQIAVAIIFAQALILLLLAAVIAFGRKGWVRWVFAVLVIARYAWPAAITLGTSGLPFERRWEIYANGWWSAPHDFLWLGIWILVLVLLALPDSRPWFRKAHSA
jgi:hypothetical protein